MTDDTGQGWAAGGHMAPFQSRGGLQVNFRYQKKITPKNTDKNLP